MNDIATSTQTPLSATSSSEQPIFSLLAAAHSLEAKVEAALGSVGLSSPKFSVLSELVAAEKPLALSDLATRLSCVRSNMTQLVDRLETEGLVRRVDCPNDRRSVKAEITDAGRAKHAAGKDVVDRLNAEFAGAVGPVERRALERLLSVLR